MSQPPPEEAPSLRVLRLLLVVALTVGAFTVALAVGSFVLQDVPLGAAAAEPALLDAGPVPSAPLARAAPLDDDARRAALAALAPVLERCLVESRRQDPGAGDHIEVAVELTVSGSRGAFGPPSLPPETSPFLRGCLQREVARTRFPHDGVLAGTLRVSAGKQGARLVGERLAADAGAADGG